MINVRRTTQSLIPKKDIPEFPFAVAKAATVHQVSAKHQAEGPHLNRTQPAIRWKSTAKEEASALDIDCLAGGELLEPIWDPQQSKEREISVSYAK